MAAVAALSRRNALVLADLVPGALVRDAFLVIGAAGFVGLLAQIVFPLSFTPVPITGQTLGVLLSGTALGWRRGLLAMLLYGAAGVLGVPWFAGHASGFTGPTFGYIVGFCLCAVVCGALARRGADRTVLKALPAMLAGQAAIYTLGVAWLAVYAHVGAAEALALGLAPFVIGDAIKTVVAALVLPGAWRLADARRSTGR